MSKGNRTRRIAAGLLPERQFCGARARDGSPCKNAPVLGAKVCRMHGGSAPQVKEKAAARLREGVMPMLATLYRLANDDSVPPAVQLAAVRDWLDRSGIKEAIAVEVTVQPWERLVDGIVAEVSDELLRDPGALVVGDYAQRDWIPGEVVEDDEDVPLIDGLPVPQPPAPTAEVRIPSRRQRRGTTLRR